MRMVQIDAELVDEIVHRIVETIRPEKVILFGSRARGDAQPESDLDLLVIADSTQPRYRRSAPLYGALSDILAPMDSWCTAQRRSKSGRTSARRS
jgi:predicted nucleotidyltransferase